MSTKQILSIGQCAADHGAISETLRKNFQADVVAVASLAEALAKLQTETFDLVLVNRLLDADGSPGIEIIRELKSKEAYRHLPVMLVTNFEDAQKTAMEAGGSAGFGKASLGQPHMLERLRPWLAAKE